MNLITFIHRLELFYFYYYRKLSYFESIIEIQIILSFDFRYATQQKSDSWFQYYYDAIGYPHADDPQGKARTISPQWRWRYGERSIAVASQRCQTREMILFAVLIIAFNY